VILFIKTTFFNTLQGDDGGPVVRDGEIVGIILHNKPCARNIPDIHTDVYKHMGFILSVLLDKS
jgi:secreted trypsin-like serine protease